MQLHTGSVSTIILARQRFAITHPLTTRLNHVPTFLSLAYHLHIIQYIEHAQTRIPVISLYPRICSSRKSEYNTQSCTFMSQPNCKTVSTSIRIPTHPMPLLPPIGHQLGGRSTSQAFPVQALYILVLKRAMRRGGRKRSRRMILAEAFLLRRQKEMMLGSGYLLKSVACVSLCVEESVKACKVALP